MTLTKQTIPYLPESPPNVKAHDVQPKEARLERVVHDESCNNITRLKTLN